MRSESHGLGTPGSTDVRNFNWLLSSFVESTSGVTDAVAVSSDGLLMAMSSSLERAGAEQLAAIIAGMTSLAESTARCFALGAPRSGDRGDGRGLPLRLLGVRRQLPRRRFPKSAATSAPSATR